MGWQRRAEKKKIYVVRLRTNSDPMLMRTNSKQFGARKIRKWEWAKNNGSATTVANYCILVNLIKKKLLKL